MYFNNKTRSILAIMAVVGLMFFASIQLSSSAAIKPRAAKKDVPKITGNFQPITDDKNGPKSIDCFCNLPECGEKMKCSTVFGCFSELQPVMSDADNGTPAPVFAEMGNGDVRDGEAKSLVFNNHGSNYSYGCLDFLSANKTCVQILQSMESDGSEFPSLAKPAAQENVMRAYKCCEKDMCNEQGNVNADDKPVHSLSSMEAVDSAETADNASSTTTGNTTTTTSNTTTTTTNTTTTTTTTTTSSPSLSVAEENVTTATTVDSVGTENVTATTVDSVGTENVTTSASVTADSNNYTVSSKISNDTVVASYNDSTIVSSNTTEHNNFTSSAASNNDTAGITVTTVEQFADNVTDSTQAPITTTVAAAAADYNATQTSDDVATAYSDNVAVISNSIEHGSNNSSTPSSYDVTTVIGVAATTAATDHSDNSTPEAVVIDFKTDVNTMIKQ